VTRGTSVCPAAGAGPVRLRHGPAQRGRCPERTGLLGPHAPLRARASPPGPAGALTPRGRPPHSHRKNAPAGNTRAPLLRSTGVDLGAVHGSSASLAQTMLAESGTAMHQWPQDNHCGSWLGLAPQNDRAGGQGLKRRTMKNRDRAAQAFRRAAPAVVRSHGACGAFSRRLKGRRGLAQAFVATAHKIARTVSHRLTDRVPSHDIGAAASTSNSSTSPLTTLGYFLVPSCSSTRLWCKTLFSLLVVSSYED